MIHIIKISLLAFALSATLSCVKQEYDLSKGVDTSIDINGSLSLPLGSSELITLSECLQSDETSSLKTDEQGRYFFEIDKRDNPIGCSYTMEPIVLPETTHYYPLRVERIMGFCNDSGQNRPGTLIKDVHKLLSVYWHHNFNIVMDIKIPVPEEVTDVKKVSVNTMLTLSVTNSPEIKYTLVGRATYPETLFQLPSYLKISKHNPEETRWSIDETNQIVIEESIPMKETNSIVYEVDITEIDLSEAGEIVDGYLVFQIPISGTIEGLTDIKDFETYVDDSTFDLLCTVSGATCNSVELKMDLTKAEDFAFEPQEINIYEQLPDIFKNENVKLDLYNPYIQLLTQSTLPFDLGVGMNLNAKNQAGEVNKSVNISNEQLTLRAGQNANYYISKHGGVAPEGATDIEADINSLIEDVPHTISIEDFTLKGSDDFFTLNTGDTFSSSLAYAVNIPLILGKDFQFSYDYVLNGLDISSLVNNPSFNIALSSLELKMDIENSIAMGLEIEATATDKQGQPISNTEIEVTGGVSVSAAVAGQTSTSPGSIKIGFNSPEATQKFGGLILTITGKGSTGSEDSQLASNQGFRFNNMSINLKSGK